MEKIVVDERVRLINGRVSQVLLSLTQLALLAAVLYRAYVLKQPDHEFNDLRIILFLSLGASIYVQVLLGGWAFPEPKIRSLAIIYLAFEAILITILTLIYGVPELADWPNTVLPAVLLPALALLLYYVAARYGQKRIQAQMGED